MRILHVADSYLPRLGGIELHVHDLVTQQRALGHDVTIVTGTAGPAPLNGSVIRLPTIGVLPARRSVAELSRIIRFGRFDVVHAHSSLISPLAWLGARTCTTKANVPSVLTMHSMLPGGIPGRLLRILLDKVSAGVTWTAVSTAAATALAQGLGHRDVTVLPNGIHPADWVPRKIRADDQPITIVSVMRTAPRKRPLQLLRILSAARRQVPDTQPIRAILIGSGPLDRVISRHIARSELNTWVTQAGRLSRPEIRAILEAADIYLAPAKLESFGIAALEARCAGLPVIGMACGGLGDFIRHGTEGYLVHSDEAMAAHLARLLKDPVLLRQMQVHNRTTSPLITWQSVLESHRVAYLRAGATDLTDGQWGPRLPESASSNWRRTRPSRRRVRAGVA